MPFILLLQYAYAQEEISPKEFWTINMGAIYLHPAVKKDVVFGNVSTGVISPIGGFGNYIEIGKGFKVLSNNKSVFNINMNIIYNWSSAKVNLKTYNSFGYNKFEEKVITHKINYPSLVARINNNYHLNERLGIYQAIGFRYNFKICMLNNNSSFHIPYSLGLILNHKKYNIIPVYNINIINFFSQQDKNEGYNIASYKKDYFQQMELGLKIQFNKQEN